MAFYFKAMTLSIVVVNWNTKELIRDCIDSILASYLLKIESADYEIIVVDNGSEDGSVECLRSYGDKIRLISNTSNAGYADALTRE